MKRLRPALPLVLVAAALCGAACSGDAATGAPDAQRSRRDAGASDARRPDAPTRVDAPRAADAPRPSDAQPADARPGADAPAATDAPRSADAPASTLPATCDATCRTQSLAVRFGNTSLPIERAVYGVERAGGGFAIHLEALHGGFSGCPTMSSPTPARTLVVSGLPVPRDDAPRSERDGVSATLLDYEGTLLPGAPLTRATAVRVTATAALVCTSCLGAAPPADPNGFLALELQATFPEGTIGGHVFASHCDSLDGP